ETGRVEDAWGGQENGSRPGEKRVRAFRDAGAARPMKALVEEPEPQALAPAPPEVRAEGPRVTAFHGFRSILIGALLVIALSALTLHSNLRFDRYITASSLPSGAVFMFVAVMLANALLGRIAPRRALTVSELALIFSMLFVSAALPQASVAETLVSLVSATTYPASGSPSIGLFGERMAGWLVVRDGEAVRLFFEGMPSGGGAIPWAAWLAPLLGWSVFVLLLLWALYCLSRIFTHRWVREERVSFPLMELPMELLGGIGSPRPLWRNPLMYLGAAIPATTILMGQLHGWYPFIPGFQQIYSVKIGEGWTAPPYNALSEFTFSVWPMVIGISYFISGEVARSIVLFHLLFWAQLLFWSMLGYGPGRAEAVAGAFSPLEWIHYMEFGGAMALSVVLFWPIRRDVTRAAGALLRRERDTSLPVPPWAVGGFLAGTAGMLAWSAAAGANPAVVAAFLLFLYAIVIALGRMVAAGGLYLVDNDFTPQGILYGLSGVRGIGGSTHYVLTGQESLFGRADMSFFYFAINDSKLAHQTRTEGGRHSLGIAVATLAALASAYVFILLWGYRYGANSFTAWPFSWRVPDQFGLMAGYLGTPRGPNPWTYLGVGVGIGVALLLVYLNRRFLWWAVSPFGFVMGSSWNVAYQIWSSVLIGGVIASLIRRYGGLKVYRALRPFFLGLILGDAVPYTLIVLVESLVGVKAGG
ncbi:MAG: hypothetical protein KY468_17840, partial [Armatimonadetes bacterium]|nr:hypothetical protein [Armatimonadota bacterium]